MVLAQRQDLPCYRVSDYEQWQGDWELIDGIPYAMSPAPNIAHQLISANIHGQLFQRLAHCCHCKPLLPVDWKIDDETVVQPDNLVVCGKVSGQYLTKTPVIIFEILSKSTARKDQRLKFELYQQEGVSYYIMVNPESGIAKLFRRKS